MVYSSAQFHLTPEVQAKLSAMFPPKPNATDSSYLNEGWDNAGWLYVLHPIPELDNKVLYGKRVEGGDKGKSLFNVYDDKFTCVFPVEVTFGAWAYENPPRNKAQMLEYVHNMVMAPGYEIPSWILDLFDVLCGESVEEPVIGIYSTRKSASSTRGYNIANLFAASSSYVQYHLASNLPSNFVAIGDAVMELNPVFG